jgi:hypothetical protein
MTTTQKSLSVMNDQDGNPTGEDRNEQSWMLTHGATRFSILEVDPSAVVSFNWICFASQDSDLNVM